MNSDFEFKAIRNAYYPGAYSPSVYNVVIAFFSDEDKDNAIDTAYSLQKDYSGHVKPQRFLAKLKKGERLGDKNQSPVSIYDGTAYFSKTNFIQRFVIEFIYTDEVFILDDKSDSPCKKYLIASCKLMKLPIFRLKKNKYGLYKEEIADDEVEQEILKFFENELIHENQEDDDPIQKIVINYDYERDFHGVTSSGKIIGITPFFSNVPLNLTRRIYEWADHADADQNYYFNDAKFSDEQEEIVGALNHLIGSLYQFETANGSLGKFDYSEKKRRLERARKGGEVFNNRCNPNLIIKNYYGKIGSTFIVSLANNQTVKVYEKGLPVVLSDKDLGETDTFLSPKVISKYALCNIQKILNNAKEFTLSTGISHDFYVTVDQSTNKVKLIPKNRQELLDIVSYMLKKQEPKLSLYDIDVSNVSDFSSIFSTVRSDDLFMGHSRDSFMDFDFSGLKSWDMSSAENLSNMFNYNPIISKFSDAIANWDTSNVRNMSHMFEDCSEFNGNLGKWDVSKVEDMSYMFYDSCDDSEFEGNGLENWDVSSVITMKSMFKGTDILIKNIKNWNTSNVVDMSEMFMHSYGVEDSEQDNLGQWDVSNVEDMAHMFDEAFDFHGIGLENWNVSKLRSVAGMFYLTLNINEETFQKIDNSWDHISSGRLFDPF